MKKSLLSLSIMAASLSAFAQISFSTISTNVNGGSFSVSTPNTTTTTTTTTYSNTNQNGNGGYSNGRNNGTNTLSFTPSAGSGSTGNTNYNNNGNYYNGNNGYYNNGYYNNGYNGNYGNNGYNYGYNNNGYNNSNSYNYNNTYNNQNQSSYTTNTDGYGTTVEVEDENGKRTIVETTTDSTQAQANRSIKDKINAHMVHFTGLVMSDQFNEGNLSKAYVMDKYSEFLKPGKYNNISTTLPNSTAYTFDGIAVPPKTRLIIYSGPNYTGAKLVDVTGPAIINNNKWEFDERYTGANKKTYCPELQTTFPQNVRQWSTSNMHDWQNGSIEILEVVD